MVRGEFAAAELLFLLDHGQFNGDCSFGRIHLALVVPSWFDIARLPGLGAVHIPAYACQCLPAGSARQNENSHSGRSTIRPEGVWDGVQLHSSPDSGGSVPRCFHGWSPSAWLPGNPAPVPIDCPVVVGVGVEGAPGCCACW